MARRTAEQSRQLRIDIMGKDLGLLYDSIYNEVFWIHLKWLQFEELYGSKQRRIEIMNRSAPFFFFTVQKVLWNDILLGLSRITDNETIAGKKNITIKSLPALISNEQLKDQVSTLIDQILLESIFCRDWRNRTIAHKDYILSVDSANAKPLEAANRKKVTELIQLFHDLLNKFEAHFVSSQVIGLKHIKAHGGAFSLLVRLNDGLKRDQELLKRKLSGTVTPEDYDKDEL